jgi:hypothetical protein
MNASELLNHLALKAYAAGSDEFKEGCHDLPYMALHFYAKYEEKLSRTPRSKLTTVQQAFEVTISKFNPDVCRFTSPILQALSPPISAMAVLGYLPAATHLVEPINMPVVEVNQKAFDEAIDYIKETYKEWKLPADPSPSDISHLLLKEIGRRSGNPISPLTQPLHHKTIIGLLGRDHFQVNSSNTYQALREALSLNKFGRSEDSPWPTARLDKGDTKGFAQLRPMAADSTLSAEQETALADLMWKQREQLSDLDTDALDALSAIWLCQAKSEKDDAIVEVDDLLKLRGLSPKLGGQGRRGGFDTKQRAEMLAAVSHVMNLWLSVAQVEVQENGRKRKPVTETVQSRPFVMSDRMGQLNLNGGMDVRRFIFRPGRVFSRYLFGPGRMVASARRRARLACLSRFHSGTHTLFVAVHQINLLARREQGRQ